VGHPHYGVLAAVRALHAAGYAPWLAISQPGTYTARSRATVGIVSVPDPYFDREGFVRELAAAAARLSVVAVLPSTDIHFLTLSCRETDFTGITLGTASLESFKRGTDKALLPELARAAGLRTPPTVKIGCGDAETVGMFGFPTIVKPRRSLTEKPDGTVLAHNVRYVSSAEQAEKAVKALPGREGLAQQYMPGQLVSVSGVSWEGEIVCALHQASIRIWPVVAGVSAYAETIPRNVELEQGVGYLLQAIGWSGLFQAQFIRSPHGEHYLIDLNLRVYGSLALAVSAGLNLPGIWVDLLLGRRPDVDDYRVGARFRQEAKDVCALAWMLGNGEFRHVLQGLIPRRNTAHAIFSLRDPMLLLRSAMKAVPRLRRRTSRHRRHQWRRKPSKVGV
jgi:predicted ATP-grasp superfamily ATP-dependent carboligase